VTLKSHPKSDRSRGASTASCIGLIGLHAPWTHNIPDCISIGLTVFALLAAEGPYFTMCVKTRFTRD